MSLAPEDRSRAASVAAPPLQDTAGARRWRLQISLMVNFFLLMALYSGVLGVLLPGQIAAFDPVRKTDNLALMFAVTSVFSTVTTPVAGAFSDRTRGRFGRRSPWIAIGGIAGSICLIGAASANSFWSLMAFWVAATVAYNSMQPALTAVIADRVPVAARGVVSGVVGAGMTAGLTAGTVMAGYLAGRRPLAYGLLAGAVAFACLIFVLTNREAPAAQPPARRFRLLEFLASFWIDPRQHPDFAWAFAGRFSIYMGYQAIAAYLLYILQDYVRLTPDRANKAIAAMALVTLVFLVISSLISGWLSDRWRRRKPFVFLSSLVMGVAMILPLLMPNMAGMWGYAAVIGIGYGMFMSIDLALMTQVLPPSAEGDQGKDLGLLTTAVNIPQIISPVMAALLLHLTGGHYAALFMAAIVFVFASSLCVLPIHSVK